MALSNPEKLQALAGPWGEFIVELQKKYITGGEWTIGTLLHKFEVTRGRPFQVLTAFTMMANSEGRVDLTSSTQSKFLKRTDNASQTLPRCELTSSA
jgi:hypothetical protein